MDIFKNKILFLLFLIFLFQPVNTFACGVCIDHSLDWFAPFILPMFPVAFVYLLTRRILHVFKILPDSISKPKVAHFIVFIALAFFLIYIGMGSLGLVMIAFIAAALQNYLRSWIAVWRISKASPDVKPSKTFQIIFLCLWLVSCVAAILWTSSGPRMMYHLSYRGGSFNQARAYYAANVFQYKELIKEKLDSACDGPYQINPLVLSSIFFLSSKINDSSHAPCIAKLLISNVSQDNIYFDIFFEEGLFALKSLNKAVLIKTCITLLDSKALSEKNFENIGHTYGERLSLILSYLIKNSQQKEYKRFITKDNIKIMQKYRYEKEIEVQGSHTIKSKNIIGLKGLNLDLEKLD